MSLMVAKVLRKSSGEMELERHCELGGIAWWVWVAWRKS